MTEIVITPPEVITVTATSPTAYTITVTQPAAVTVTATSESHLPVTIGTANGLSLATQTLSLGLASAGVTGALSGTDWSTFNAKEPAITILQASRGGTGINNSFNLTVSGTSTINGSLVGSITGGGTVATGGFTLTVPATGTAALLATANTFTAAQFIDGSADTIQLIVQAAVGQTANIITLESSSGTDLMTMGVLGNLALGSGAVPVTTARFLLAENIGTASDTTTRNGQQINYLRTATRTSGTDYGLNILISNRSTNSGTAVGGSYAIENRAVTLANAFPLKAIVYGNGTDAGAITTAAAITADVSAAGQTITAAHGVLINAFTVAAGAITTATGLTIGNQTVGTTNYAIYTNAGIVRFGDVVLPVQATTAAAPAYRKGGIYFDTTLNKLRIGGATAWETVTSV